MQDIIYEDNASEEKDFLHYRQKRDTRTLQEQKELSRDLLIAAIAIGAVLVLFFIIVVVVRVRKYMQNKKKVKKQPRGHGQKEKLQHTRNNRHSIKHGREEKALRSHRSQRSKMEPIAESEAWWLTNVIYWWQLLMIHSSERLSEWMKKTPDPNERLSSNTIYLILYNYTPGKMSFFHWSFCFVKWIYLAI